MYTKIQPCEGGEELLKGRTPVGEDKQQGAQGDAIIHFSVADIAAKRLKSCIEDGLFGPDEKISEADLSKEMGISRTTIRKALLTLEAQGMLKHIPGYGMVVLGKEGNGISIPCPKEISTKD